MWRNRIRWDSKTAKVVYTRNKHPFLFDRAIRILKKILEDILKIDKINIDNLSEFFPKNYFEMIGSTLIFNALAVNEQIKEIHALLVQVQEKLISAGLPPV